MKPHAQQTLGALILLLALRLAIVGRAEYQGM